MIQNRWKAYLTNCSIKTLPSITFTSPPCLGVLTFVNLVLTQRHGVNTKTQF